MKNKLLIYKTIIKPIWTYGIQLWGMASNSNVEILECFKSKALCMVTNASWIVQNAVILKDLETPIVTEEIRCFSSQYGNRLSANPRKLSGNLMTQPDNNE
ncbi:hypothetical protein B7P43_G00779 [Cryptotermes secundus]|uniref:Uncharacterized protein n=1 Tax=Cryptotermes secundus TaxID=105785 RepID=A0A2J7QSF9_9NEOP|nr:hypothetical protein B7P43_G00779 [Cryptotermes secundus]